jgi:hypothetical protein
MRLVGGDPRPDDPSAARPDPPPGGTMISAMTRFPAGDAGFVFLLDDTARSSADGWDGMSVSSTISNEALPTDVVVTNDEPLAVGNTLFGGAMDAWFGRAAISR